MTTEDKNISRQTDVSTSQPTLTTVRARWLVAGLGGVVLGACAIIALLVLACAGVWFCVVGGIGSEPANIPTAERVTREFVAALHDEDIQSAYQMLVEEVRTKQALDELTSLHETSYIKKYQGLDVCEFGVFFTDAGRVLVAKGTLRHEGGSVLFESDLRQESDGVWRVYKFILQPGVDPTPWGACQ